MTPGEHVLSWTRRSTPVAELRTEFAVRNSAGDPGALFELAAAAARSVLVDPTQLIEDVNAFVEPLTTATEPAERLAALDLINALTCAGALIRPELEARARQGLAELATVGPPLALRMRVGLAAIVYGELEVAAGIAPEIPRHFIGSLAFPNDALALLGYLVRAARDGAVLRTLLPAWRCVADELDDLCASDQLDESAVLWLARVVYQHFGNEPVDRIAALAHGHLWEDPAPATNEASEFPLTDTLDGGAYRVERHLRGSGSQTLWLGVEVASGASVLVSCDGHTPEKQDVGELRRAISYQVPGLFELAYVGAFDTDGTDYRRDAAREGAWATVEKVSSGSWLPRILGPADPWTAPTKAIELGRSAGTILVRAAAGGVNLVRIRPELMWAERRDGHIAVTGLSPRATELFARKVGEMVTHPLFDRFYHAPEIYEDPDDRAIAYSLAVMVAEWATGRYPFASLHAPNGLETGRHEPIHAPRPLASLLEATIRRNREDRPRLAEFVNELELLQL